MASIWILQPQQMLSFQYGVWSNVVELGSTEQQGGLRRYGYLNWSRKRVYGGKFVWRIRALTSNSVMMSSDGLDKPPQNRLTPPVPVPVPVTVPVPVPVVDSINNVVSRLQQTIISLPPPLIFLNKRNSRANFAIGVLIAAALLVIAVRIHNVRKSRLRRPGTVADLVRRGQLKSDRRGISKPLKYEDPFNNPLVKVGKSNLTVEMCGKVYRLAPVTLTKEQQAIHQKRRSRAYEWKRPTLFLKEGDSVPPDVDPDTIRWIPANHPFATTSSDINEDLAQNNVYQKHGVPFRIKAEHEALQKKLEALQSEQKLDKLVIDPGTAKEYERPFKSHLKSDEQVEPVVPSNPEVGSTPKSNRVPNSTGNRSSYEEMQKP